MTSRYGGDAVLPQWGLVVDGPRFAAFYAWRWNGQDYPGGALFTLRGADGESLDGTRRVRVFHAFGHPAIRWHDRVHEVRREKTIER